MMTVMMMSRAACICVLCSNVAARLHLHSQTFEVLYTTAQKHHASTWDLPSVLT